MVLVGYRVWQFNQLGVQIHKPNQLYANVRYAEQPTLSLELKPLC